MNKKICLFAGTTEGRELASMLHGAAELTVCVATEYGEIMLDGIDGINVRAGRMDGDEMERFFSECGFGLIVDATHPYAEIVTRNIKAAADACGIPVIRLLRESDRTVKDAVYIPSVEAAGEYLSGTEGNIFITTGSKEIGSYTGLDMSRVWARVLPTVSALELCAAAGLAPSHIIAAQGPFSEEINLAQLRAIGAKYLVTKASGKNGGFEEKISAAKAAGAVPVIIGRPPQTEGLSFSETAAELSRILQLEKRRADIIGVGPGGGSMLTFEAKEALKKADAVIGAASVIPAEVTGKPEYHEFMPDKIRALLDSDLSIRRAAVVMRGDTGFYSGAKNLVSALGGYEVNVMPGVSSVSALAARMGVSWDDASLISLHGRDGNLIRTVDSSAGTFVLTGGENTVGAVCGKLCEYGFGGLAVTVGERLSYPDEKITSGTAQELSGSAFDSLSVMYIENGGADSRIRTGIPDEEFIRGDTPMTKSEVRAVSLSRLELTRDAVIYDIGAGTGSVSVECALAAEKGKVYAVEKDHDAAELIKENKIKFRADNIVIVEGSAPEALADLPAPTHAFIGGSSGELKDIISLLISKNPDVRIVVNAITLETQAQALQCAKEFGFGFFETVSVNISRSRKLGRYNMMTAQNPVYVITMKGAVSDG